jgi:ferredoxin
MKPKRRATKGHSGRGDTHFLSYAMSYQITIDRTLCSGYAECAALAPEVFHLGKDKISTIVDPEGADDDTILDAARACPVDAIILVDEFEDQVWPA